MTSSWIFGKLNCWKQPESCKKNRLAARQPVAEKPKRRFKTDGVGNIPAGVRLLPNAAYIAELPERKSASRIETHVALTEWVENCVLGDLKTLRLGIDAFSREKPEGLGEGNFLLLASSLMALEYVSRIYSSQKDATSCVREYALRWLTPVNDKYRIYWKILWIAARNGIIHGSWPHRLSFEDDPTEYRFSVGCDPSDPHLVRDGDHIFVNAGTFLEDLGSSITGGFSTWLRSCTDPLVLERGQPRVQVISANDKEGTDALQKVLSWKD